MGDHDNLSQRGEAKPPSSPVILPVPELLLDLETALHGPALCHMPGWRGELYAQSVGSPAPRAICPSTNPAGPMHLRPFLPRPRAPSGTSTLLGPPKGSSQGLLEVLIGFTVREQVSVPGSIPGAGGASVSLRSPCLQLSGQSLCSAPNRPPRTPPRLLSGSASPCWLPRSLGSPPLPRMSVSPCALVS